MIKFSFPYYKLPGKDYFVGLIEKLHEEKLEVLKSKLDKATSVCLTSDLWTSINQQSFITITCPFIDEDGKINEFVLETKSLGDIAHTGQNLNIVFRSVGAK